MDQRATVMLLAVLLPSLLAPVGVAAQQVAEPALLPAVELPVNLERVKQKLAALPATEEERSRLRLAFYLDVYGRAPRFNPLEGFDIHTGPIPFGAPSHADLRDFWTPEAFRAPVVDLTSVLGWIFNR